MLRLIMIMGLWGLAGTACSGEGITLSNARQLREFLTTGRPSVTAEASAAQRGCGPEGCRIDIGGVSIDREHGLLVGTENKHSILIRPQVAGELPELDWEPLGGFAVSVAGQHWGSCLEFSHAGLGKSGRYQRWTSVILVPWLNTYPGSIAYRFVGYWAGCDLILAGDKPGEIRMPVIQRQEKPGAAPSLQIVWHTCTALACQPNQDRRAVTEDINSDAGALIVGPVSPSPDP